MEIKAVKGFGKLGVAVTDIAYPFIDSEIQELRKLNEITRNSKKH